MSGTQTTPDPGIDERYYPVTDRIDWEPLIEAGVDPDEWMFMMVSEDGTRYYKNSRTRDYLHLWGPEEEDVLVVARALILSGQLSPHGDKIERARKAARFALKGWHYGIRLGRA